MFAAEDPFIWRGTDRYWAVVKDNAGHFTKRGYSLALWESADGLDWKLAKHPLVATPEMTWADGRQAETRRAGAAATAVREWSAHRALLRRCRCQRPRRQFQHPNPTQAGQMTFSASHSVAACRQTAAELCPRARRCSSEPPLPARGGYGARGSLSRHARIVAGVVACLAGLLDFVAMVAEAVWKVAPGITLITTSTGAADALQPPDRFPLQEIRADRLADQAAARLERRERHRIDAVFMVSPRYIESVFDLERVQQFSCHFGERR